MSNSFDPDQDRHSVWPDLCPNCLQRLLADDTSKQRVKCVSYHLEKPRVFSPVCSTGLKLRVCTQKIFFLFLNQNIVQTDGLEIETYLKFDAQNFCVSKPMFHKHCVWNKVN